MNFTEKELRKINSCPWCNCISTNARKIYETENGTTVVKCKVCGLVYSTKILNEEGLQKYWSCYESSVHNATEELVRKRKRMYRMEYDYISRFLNKKNNLILDIGCGGGEFLEEFNQNGNICEGVEYGQEAYDIAKQNFKVYLGIFPEMEFDKKYDLIIFRGTIQYLIEPKKYLKKAIETVKEGGYIYITSSPNSDSFCLELFEDKYNQRVSETDYYMYNESILTSFFHEFGCNLVGEKNFYRGTPYEDCSKDILKIAEAIRLKSSGEKINFNSPAFFDNMLTLVYKKGNCQYI